MKLVRVRSLWIQSQKWIEGVDSESFSQESDILAFGGGRGSCL